MLTLFFINALVLCSAFALTYKGLRFKEPADSLIGLFLLYLAQIIITELFLGILGWLYLPNLILLNAAILAVVVFSTRKEKYNFNFEYMRAACVELAGNKVVLFVACVLSAFALVKLSINLLNPPFGWDNLNYHFTFPVEWIKHANLYNPITINDDPAPPYYPINGSLFYLWLIFPLKSVFIADLGQLPFFILSFLSVYNISRKIGSSREYSLYAAGIFFLIPNFFKQLEIAYVDVMVCGLFLACVNFLISRENRLSKKRAFLFFISFGLLLGVKSVAVPYSALLILPFFYLYFKNVKNLGRYLPVFILISLTLGGFGYLRNILETGNPFYPLELKLFGSVIFKGVIDSQTWRAHFTAQDYNLFKDLLHEGLGLQTALFVLPAAALSLPIILLKKKKLDFNLFYLSLLPVSVYLIYRFIIPLANVRYIFAAMAIAMPLGFYIISSLNVPVIAARIATVVFVIASMAEIAKHEELIAAVILAMVLFIVAAAYFPKLAQKIKISVSLFKIMIFGVIFLLAGLFFLEINYNKNEYRRYNTMVDYSGFWPDATLAWEWLNNNSQGDNIAYVGRPVPFPLYGSNFKNNVYYVSVNKTDPAKLHYYPNSRYSWGRDFISLQESLNRPENYRGQADYAAWLDNLLKRDTGYLFVYSLHQTEELAFPVEDRWAMSNPQFFLPVFTNQTVHIYKVQKKAGSPREQG